MIIAKIYFLKTLKLHSEPVAGVPSSFSRLHKHGAYSRHNSGDFSWSLTCPFSETLRKPDDSSNYPLLFLRASYVPSFHKSNWSGKNGTIRSGIGKIVATASKHRSSRRFSCDHDR